MKGVQEGVDAAGAAMRQWTEGEEEAEAESRMAVGRNSWSPVYFDSVRHEVKGHPFQKPPPTMQAMLEVEASLILSMPLFLLLLDRLRLFRDVARRWEER